MISAIRKFQFWIEKQKVAYHKHESFPEHPVAVKAHGEYFSALRTFRYMGGKPKKIINKVQLNDLTLDFLESLIKLPPEKWKGNCYAFARYLSPMLGGKPIMGYWKGPKGKFFQSIDRWGKPNDPIGHGWLELQDGTVVDPVKWVFEDRDPYIFIGKDTNYSKTKKN